MHDSLILLAHHDDEFFLAPLIRDDCAAGAAVHVCYLTHGSVYGADATARAAESRLVLNRLGVAGEGIADLGLEQGIFDGELAEKAGRALGAVAARYAGRRFGRIYLMAWEGGHHDHDAAHLIALAYADRAQPGARLREFPLYNSHGAPAPPPCSAHSRLGKRSNARNSSPPTRARRRCSARSGRPSTGPCISARAITTGNSARARTTGSGRTLAPCSTSRSSP